MDYDMPELLRTPPQERRLSLQHLLQRHGVEIRNDRSVEASNTQEVGLADGRHTIPAC